MVADTIYKLIKTVGGQPKPSEWREKMSGKLEFGEMMAELSLGLTALSVMNDCEKYGMVSGCDENCPQLERGECEIYGNLDGYFKEQNEPTWRSFK